MATRIGVDYYPEHWDPTRWETDARMMKEAGITLIRIAEFGWSLMEPSEGVYDFSLFDRAIELFANYGIRVILGTPTATPPKWLVDAYPSVLQEDKQGHPRVFGSRRHYCFNSPVYREKAKVIVQKMAAHYAGNPHVAAWQIDNEFGCQDTTQCYCDDCARAFRTWLKVRYGNIDALNAAWGTVFWSQIYRSFDEIIPPRASTCEGSCEHTKGQNPSLMLDYKRFSSDSVVDFQKIQVDIVRAYSDAPVTTNFMGYFSGIDYYKLAADLDFVAWDNYPDTQWGRGYPMNGALGHTMMRSLKKAPIWVMEQQSGPCGWGEMGANPEPGKLRLWTWQAVANGADTIVYFRWRAALFGTEQYWHGILNHDGQPNRRYEEIARTSEEVRRFGERYPDVVFRPHAAIIQSYDSLWSHSIQPHAQGFSADQMLTDTYDALYVQGIGADFVAPDESLDSYRVVFAPALNVVDKEMHDRLADYVIGGGHLVLTYRSGTRTQENTMYPLPTPGLFADLVGATAEDFDPQAGRSVGVTGVFGDSEAHIWCDVLKLDTASALAVYTGQYYEGKPAVTVNRLGKGYVYYLGCDLEADALRRLYRRVLERAGVPLPFPQPLPGVEITQAESSGKTLWFILNHNEGVRMLEIDGVYTNALTGGTVSETLFLPPYDVVILES